MHRLLVVLSIQYIIRKASAMHPKQAHSRVGNYYCSGCGLGTEDRN